MKARNTIEDHNLEEAHYGRVEQLGQISLLVRCQKEKGIWYSAAETVQMERTDKNFIGALIPPLTVNDLFSRWKIHGKKAFSEVIAHPKTGNTGKTEK